jgi:hypothetical protein
VDLGIVQVQSQREKFHATRQQRSDLGEMLVVLGAPRLPFIVSEIARRPFAFAG